jgi:hypothetical protein
LSASRARLFRVGPLVGVIAAVSLFSAEGRGQPAAATAPAWAPSFRPGDTFSLTIERTRSDSAPALGAAEATTRAHVRVLVLEPQNGVRLRWTVERVEVPGVGKRELAARLAELQAELSLDVRLDERGQPLSLTNAIEVREHFDRAAARTKQLLEQRDVDPDQARAILEEIVALTKPGLVEVVSLRDARVWLRSAGLPLEPGTAMEFDATLPDPRGGTTPLLGPGSQRVDPGKRPGTLELRVQHSAKAPAWSEDQGGALPPDMPRDGFELSLETSATVERSRQIPIDVRTERKMVFASGYTRIESWRIRVAER